MRLKDLRLALAGGVLTFGAVGAHANSLDVHIQAVLNDNPSAFLCYQTAQGPQCESIVIGSIEGDIKSETQCVPPMDCRIAHPPVIKDVPLHYSQTFQNIAYYFMDYKTKADLGRGNTAKLNYTVAFTALAGWVCEERVADAVIFRGDKTEIPYKRDIALDMSNCQVTGGTMPIGGGPTPIGDPIGGPIGGFPGPLPPTNPPGGSMGPGAAPAATPGASPAMTLPRMNRP